VRRKFFLESSQSGLTSLSIYDNNTTHQIQVLNALPAWAMRALQPLLFLSLTSGLAFSQADIPNPNNYGTPVNGVFVGSNIDSVNLATGGLHVDIPLLDLPGIGMGTHIHYIYDNLVWNQTSATQPSGQWWITLYQDRPLWKFQDPLQAGVTIKSHYQVYSGTSTAAYIDYVSFEDMSGTSHQFPLQGFVDSVPSGDDVPPQGYSLDSSGVLITLNNTGGAVSAIDKHGTKYNFDAAGFALTSIEDSNGNKITGTWTQPNQQSLWTETLTDTLSRTITATWNGYGSATGANPNVEGSVQSVTYTDQNGNPQTINIDFEPVQINLAIACLGNTATCGPRVGIGASTVTVMLPQSIILQDGKAAYSFTYEPNGLGELDSITLPTGGVISYTWSPSATQSGRAPLTRKVAANGQTSTWKFTPGSGNTEIVTDPGLNDTVYTCTYYTPVAGVVPAACYMTEEDFYSGSHSTGTLVATKKTTYTITGSVMPTSTTFKWNQTSQVTETDTKWEGIPNSGFNPGAQDNPNIDVSRGNKIYEIVYDYGSGSPGALLRNTQYNYWHLQNSAYLGPNIADRMSQESVYSCNPPTSACLVAQTTTAYDQFNQTSVDGQGGLTSTSGTTQHDYTNYATSETMRGLPTSVTKYVGQGFSPIVTYTNYNDVGNPTATTDGFDTPARSTSYRYGAQNAFVSSITLPLIGSVQQTLSRSQDVNTGLLMSTTDQNQKTTSYSYDSRMRLHIIQRPDGGSTTINYPDDNHTNTTVTQDPDPQHTTSAVLDDLGRTISSVGPNGETTATTYDLLGRIGSVSNPYFSTNDSSYGITSYQYDALGRKTYQCQPDNTSTPTTTCLPTNSYLQWNYSGGNIDFYDEAKRHWQQVFDALGRLTKVLEPDTSNSPTIETDYQYDWLSNLRQVDQWGGPNGTDRKRTFNYDAVSRLLCASNPENATTQCPTQASPSYTAGIRMAISSVRSTPAML